MERPFFLANFSSQFGNKRYHFVVYGLPAIASAIGSKTIATVKAVDGEGWTVDDQRIATPGYKDKKFKEAQQAIINVIEHLNIDIINIKLEITFTGDLVAASGVGASAAQCTSLARALSEEFNLNLNDEKINEAAYAGEMAYHGTPSGIDNTASTYGGLIWFVKNLSGGKNTIDRLKSAEKMHLIIANTGITASTAKVVADVRKLREEDPEKFNKIFNKYEKIAKNAKKALIKGDRDSVGKLMNQNHKLLQLISVSSQINDKIVDIALNNGAIGAKMTGTGRGGLVIALTLDENNQKRVSTAIENKGFSTWKTTIG
ncbi:MAG: mevalonate kinase [Promethearchaeota archaeon]|jgi:mevalonate kinase